MKIIIDSIDGSFASIELPCGKMENIPVSILPAGSEEGGILEITLLSEETDLIKQQIKEKMKRIFKEG